MRIRFALEDVVTVREVQSLRGRKLTTRERGVAFIATRPATQYPVIGGDYEASYCSSRWPTGSTKYPVRVISNLTPVRNNQSTVEFPNGTT